MQDMDPYQGFALLRSLLRGVSTDYQHLLALQQQERQLSPTLARRCVLEAQILTLTRLFDKPRFDKQGQSGRVSLIHMLVMLEDRDLRSFVMAQAVQWVPDMPELAHDNQCQALRAMMHAMTRFRRVFRNPSQEREQISLLRNVRDTVLAHHLLDGADMPKMGDLHQAITAVSGLAGVFLQDLTLALTGEILDFSNNQAV